MGSRSLGRLLLYELVISTSSWVPGALGLLLRKLLYPLLLGAVRAGGRLRPGRGAPASPQGAPRRRRDGRRPRGAGRQGHDEPRHRGRPRRLPGARHDPLVQGRRHHARRPREPRLPLRGVLRLERDGRGARALRGAGLPGGGRPRVRGARRRGHRPAAHLARHRARRQRVARHGSQGPRRHPHREPRRGRRERGGDGGPAGRSDRGRGSRPRPASALRGPAPARMRRPIEGDEQAAAGEAASATSADTRFTTISGRPIEPVYTSRPTRGRSTTRATSAIPGQYPYTRGIHETMYRGKLWTMRQFAGFGSAAQTERALQVPARARRRRAVASPSTCRR